MTYIAKFRLQRIIFDPRRGTGDRAGAGPGAGGRLVSPSPKAAKRPRSAARLSGSARASRPSCVDPARDPAGPPPRSQGLSRPPQSPEGRAMAYGLRYM